ncbi:MAG: hypothetical protein ACRDHZ_15060 [Ktedonobacteraceae bacterium]
MSLFILTIIWAVLGSIIGALALAAHLKPTNWGRSGWCWMLALGLGSALLGGLIGLWLFGRLFSTAMGLWIAVLGSCTPWLLIRLRARFAHGSRSIF